LLRAGKQSRPAHHQIASPKNSEPKFSLRFFELTQKLLLLGLLRVATPRVASILITSINIPRNTQTGQNV
jgi:hypothetical protein